MGYVGLTCVCAAAAAAVCSGTVDCEYPRWVEFLCHDISVHVPHHVNSKIPWYNLRAANDSLKQNWGQYMTSCTFNWKMMKTIFTGRDAGPVMGWQSLGSEYMTSCTLNCATLGCNMWQGGGIM